MWMTLTIFFITSVFSPLAAVMAFTIFYNEYEHHFTDKRKAWKAAFWRAFFTLVFFFFLGFALGIILPRIFKVY